MRRLGIVHCVFAGLVLAGGLVLFLDPGARAQGQNRTFFQLAAGLTGGNYFAIGEAIAGVVSHPVGLPRCDGGACGPAGLIVSVRTSESSSANIEAVEQGLSDSGLCHSSSLADALMGSGVFRKSGPVKHVRLMASLYDEPVQLVAAISAKISSVRDLKGKRVSLGDAESGIYSVARAVLTGFRVSHWSLHRHNLPLDQAAQALREGKIDAFFYVGAAPTPAIRDLIASGKVGLVPLAGAGRERTLQRLRGYSFKNHVIPVGRYPGLPEVQTISGRALWVVRDTVPDKTVEALLFSFYNLANRAKLTAYAPLHRLSFAKALTGSSAPLHPGAKRYYIRMGLLKPVPAKKTR